jgi:hypothetical protein
VLGWATYRDQVVRVLDPERVHRLVQNSLDGQWELEEQRLASLVTNAAGV